MKRSFFKAALAAVSAIALAGTAFADDKGREIIDKALNVAKPDTNHSMIQMDLVAKNGKVEESRMIEEFGRHHSDTDTTDIVMAFRQSTNKSNQGIKFLQIENKGKDDDKWIYMPALKSTRRVNSSDGSKSFTGTDASYDDMSSRELDDDDHEFMGEEPKNGFDCFKVKSTPTQATLSKAQYAYRVQWIDKKTYVPVYAEMYDKKDKTLVKTLVVEELSHLKGATGKEYDTPTATTLTTIKTGHSTRIAATKNKNGGFNIVLDKPMNDAYFTQNFLNSTK